MSSKVRDARGEFLYGVIRRGRQHLVLSDAKRDAAWCGETSCGDGTNGGQGTEGGGRDGGCFSLLVTPDWLWPIFRAPQTARAALFPGPELRVVLYTTTARARARRVMRWRQHSRRLTTCVHGRKTFGSAAALDVPTGHVGLRATCGRTTRGLKLDVCLCLST